MAGLLYHSLASLCLCPCVSLSLSLPYSALLLFIFSLPGFVCLSPPLPAPSLCPHIYLLPPLPCLSLRVPVLVCHSVPLSVKSGPFPTSPCMAPLLHVSAFPVFPVPLTTNASFVFMASPGLSSSLPPFMSLRVSGQGSGLEATH